jgi:hypothetical protein
MQFVVTRASARANREHLTDAAKLKGHPAAIEQRSYRVIDVAVNLETPEAGAAEDRRARTRTDADPKRD